jgi:fucose permease
MFTYASTATITPICLLLVAGEFGMDLAEAGALEVSRSVLITVILLASPWISARFGKARSLGWASFFMGLGLVAYGLAPTYGALILALALVGTGSGVLEGLINPLVQDAAPMDSGRWLNLVNGFWSMGVLVTMLVGGEWLTRGGDWRPAMFALGVCSALTGIAFLRARVPGGTQEADASIAAVWQRTREVLTAPRFTGFAIMMVLAGAVEGAFTFWSATLVQLEFGASARAGGIVTACFAAGMIAGRFAAVAWATQKSLPHLILTSAIGGAVISSIIPLLGSTAAVGTGLVFAGLSVACFWPSIQSYAADRLRGESTEILILLSFAGIPGFGGVSWALGLLADSEGLRAAFWLIPPLFVAIALLMIWELRQDAPKARHR